jgi:asparagine synthase (glutamine-hydrolysing)
MCGITTILDPRGISSADDIVAMTTTLVHRGPDASGHWNEGPIALGHRRLSILDLSPAGAQPMASRCGRWIIAFNGEIYNHLSLRAELSGPWRGGSDTETLVQAIAAWGFEATLRRCIGMFAIAAWERPGQVLWLARDRMGEKPLYYGLVGQQFRAASELKALLGNAPRPAVNRDSLCLLMRHNYIPAPYTIWQGVSKLTPGHLLEVPIGSVNHPPMSRAWWSVDDLTGQPACELSDAEATEGLDALLRQVVAGQMVADVPLGAFLSGGIDSSTVVALMQAQSAQKVRTFTIGFTEPEYDESQHAEAVARHLGTEHTTLKVTPTEALAVIPELPQIWDEPFADSSQIPTLLLSRLTRQRVTVSLSGDGGDELFAGYNRHFLFGKIQRFQSLIPRPIRLAVAACISALPPAVWDGLAAPLRLFRPSALRNAGDKAHKLAGILSARTVDQLYRDLVSHWPAPSQLVIGGTELPTMLTNGRAERVSEMLARIQYLDQLSYLPDDILVKVDRAGMAASLETRIPFLDHRVVAFAWTLPPRFRVRNGQGKWILRQVLDRYVPRALIDRPKMGFGIPIGDWLRGGLRDWAESLLAEDRLRREGFFNPAPIREKWAEHLSGRRHWQYHLWDVLMFQAWLERWR